jgi:hypothetical protein
VSAARLVLLDANFYDTKHSSKEEQLSREEFIAMALHEFGHVVNEPPDCKSTDEIAHKLSIKRANNQKHVPEKELYADDYARHCDYGEHNAMCLEKAAKIMPEKFNNDEVKQRIERIRTKSALLLNLKS